MVHDFTAIKSSVGVYGDVDIGFVQTLYMYRFRTFWIHMMSSAKPEVLNVSQYRQRKTADTAIDNTHENLVKLGCVVSKRKRG